MKRLGLILLKAIGSLLGLVVVYLLMSVVLSVIPVSGEDVREEKIIPVYIYTNGMHTDLVLPVKTEQVDWSEKIPFEHLRTAENNFQYIGIGWGDKGFYLDTPTWADLKVSTALEATFWLGESAMHCTYHKEMKENDDIKKIMLTPKQYHNLVIYIDNSFDKDENFIHIPTNANYGDTDAFYEAKGSYSFVKTCNTWANSGLKVAGQKAALWTPTDKGIFMHYD